MWAAWSSDSAGGVLKMANMTHKSENRRVTAESSSPETVQNDVHDQPAQTGSQSSGAEQTVLSLMKGTNSTQSGLQLYLSLFRTKHLFILNYAFVFRYIWCIHMSLSKK